MREIIGAWAYDHQNVWDFRIVESAFSGMICLMNQDSGALMHFKIDEFVQRFHIYEDSDDLARIINLDQKAKGFTNG